MALAVKGSRFITVEESVYRWRIRRRPSLNQACYGGPLTFAVELAAARGSVLAVTITDACRPDSQVPVAQSGLVVRPALVAAVIRMALARGWQPALPGAQFRLRAASGDLPAEVRTQAWP